MKTYPNYSVRFYGRENDDDVSDDWMVFADERSAVHHANSIIVPEGYNVAVIKNYRDGSFEWVVGHD